jgi:hypothetical protein
MREDHGADEPFCANGRYEGDADSSGIEVAAAVSSRTDPRADVQAAGQTPPRLSYLHKQRQTPVTVGGDSRDRGVRGARQPLAGAVAVAEAKATMHCALPELPVGRYRPLIAAQPRRPSASGVIISAWRTRRIGSTSR